MLQCIRYVLLVIHGYVIWKNVFIIHAYITVFYHSRVIDCVPVETSSRGILFYWKQPL